MVPKVIVLAKDILVTTHRVMTHKRHQNKFVLLYKYRDAFLNLIRVYLAFVNPLGPTINIVTHISKICLSFLVLACACVCEREREEEEEEEEEEDVKALVAASPIETYDITPHF